MLMEGCATRNQLVTTFTAPPVMRVTMVSFSLPEAWRMAFSISRMQTKKDATPITTSREEPASWLPG